MTSIWEELLSVINDKPYPLDISNKTLREIDDYDFYRDYSFADKTPMKHLPSKLHIADYTYSLISELG